MEDSDELFPESGLGEHKVLIQNVYDALIKYGLSPTVPEERGRGKPDIRCPTGKPLFDGDTPLWIEVETSALKAPSGIIKHILEAQDDGAKLIYAVRGHENNREGKGVKRLRKILFDPPLTRKESQSKTQFYNDTQRLLTSEGEYVAVEYDQMDLGSSYGWWLDHETDTYHRKLNDEKSLTVQDSTQFIEGIPPDNAPCRVSTTVEREESYRVIESDGTERYTDDPTDEQSHIKRPLIPEARGIDTDTDLADIECLIVTDHAVYRQPFSKLEKVADI